jgi:hypothetical protein
VYTETLPLQTHLADLYLQVWDWDTGPSLFLPLGFNRAYTSGELPVLRMRAPVLQNSFVVVVVVVVVGPHAEADLFTPWFADPLSPLDNPPNNPNPHLLPRHVAFGKAEMRPTVAEFPSCSSPWRHENDT